MKDYIGSALDTLKELVSYYTVREEEAENAPFGKTNKACLDRTLAIAKEMGFTVKDVDGYAGHVEWKGTGDGLVGVLGHLDVVPAGEGWAHDPLKCEVENGYMYGRGVLDDKGPVVACLYAMKELKDQGFKPTKTIRLIMGCNEENGSTCVEYYFKHEAMPDIGFSPDGDFPLIHCEKGIVWVGVSAGVNLKHFKDIKGGEKTNMVPAKASCVYFGELPIEYFTAKRLEAEKCAKCGGIILTARGKNGHGSTPWVGENAVWKLLKVISEVEKNEVIDYIYNTYCQDYTGKASKIYATEEKTGELSENLGTIEEKDGKIMISVDIRFPISTSREQIFEILKKNAVSGVEFSCLNYQQYLFADTEGYLVKSLMKIYRDHTGSDSPSKVIGGGTYAREMKYGVAFGPMMENEESTIHMPNERLNLKYFETFYGIYKDAIEELSK